MKILYKHHKKKAQLIFFLIFLTKIFYFYNDKNELVCAGELLIDVLKKYPSGKAGILALKEVDQELLPQRKMTHNFDYFKMKNYAPPQHDFSWIEMYAAKGYCRWGNYEKAADYAERFCKEIKRIFGADAEITKSLLLEKEMKLTCQP